MYACTNMFRNPVREGRVNVALGLNAHIHFLSMDHGMYLHAAIFWHSLQLKLVRLICSGEAESWHKYKAAIHIDMCAWTALVRREKNSSIYHHLAKHFWPRLTQLGAGTDLKFIISLDGGLKIREDGNHVADLRVDASFHKTHRGFRRKLLQIPRHGEGCVRSMGHIISEFSMIKLRRTWRLLLNILAFMIMSTLSDCASPLDGDTIARTRMLPDFFLRTSTATLHCSKCQLTVTQMHWDPLAV